MFKLLAVVSLIALPALGTEYVITGPDLAGHANVSPGTDGKVRIKVGLATFGASRRQLGYEGTGTTTAAGLIGFVWEAGRAVTLKPDGKGGYTTTLEGRAQVWTALPRPAAGYAVLAVPGLSTNVWNHVGIPYLDENVQALQAMGFQARRLAIRTEEGVDKNAAFIATEIRNEVQRGMSVILFAHSKGATDALAALAIDPALAALVAGVVAVQPVFGGSPVAQVIEKHRLLDKAVKAVFEGVFKGQLAAVNDLSFADRAAFNKLHPYPAASVPTVVVRSTFHRQVSKSVLFANERLITLETHQPNDGMVELKDQSIAGALQTITLDDLDHFEPGLRNESRHSPVEITSRGVLALLEAMQK